MLVKRYDIVIEYKIGEETFREGHVLKSVGLWQYPQSPEIGEKIWITTKTKGNGTLCATIVEVKPFNVAS